MVLDAFHAVRLAQAAIDDVRRRVQQDTTGHRGRKKDPLYRIRRVLLRGAEHLTEPSYARLLAGLDAGDPGREVAAAWIATYIDGWNERCQPFTWTKTADQILDHCQPGPRTSFTRH